MSEKQRRTITDLDLQAVIDGELDRDTHEHIVDEVKKNPALLVRLEELFDQKFSLKEWWFSQPLT